MKKRFLVGLITAGLLLQSVSMPVLATPVGDVGTNAVEIASEFQSEQSEDSLPGDSGSDISENEDIREGGDSHEKKEETSGEAGEIKSDGSDQETSADGEEKDADAAGQKMPGDGEEKDADGADIKAPVDEERQNIDGTEQKTSVDENEQGAGEVEQEVAGKTEVVQVSGNDLEKTESEPEVVWVTAEGGGSYQEGSFTVPGDAAGSRPRRSAAYGARELQPVTEVIYEALKNKRAEIDLSEYNIPVEYSTTVNKMVSPVLMSYIIGVVNDHPELYYARTGYGFSYNEDSNTVCMVSLVYIDDVGLDDTKFQQGVQDALSSVKPGMTDLEKAIALHDYLALNCKYDYQNFLDNNVPPTSHSAYGVFAEGVAVCQGYALAYKYLLDQVGIECYMVTSDKMNHAWNLIKLGDSYYQVDVTWDDPAWDRVGRVMHTYMFRSDGAFYDEPNGHYGWSVTSGSGVVDLKAENPQYDSAFWVDASSPLVITDSSCYYTDYDGTSSSEYVPPIGGVIKKASLKDIENEGVTIQNIGLWTVFGNDNGYWPNVVSSGLFQIGDRLYYNDKTSIYSIKMDGSDRKQEFTADTTDGYIYGSAYCQGKVLYALHQSPKDEGEENVLTASLNTGGGETETYVIVYMLDGGKNDKANPTTYTADSETIILQNAVRDGYVFGGWYSDETFSAKVEQITKGSTGNLKLYAKWVEKDVSLQDDHVTFMEDLQEGLFYNGMAQTPKVMVRLSDGTTLTENMDYTVSYTNNRNAGTATVTVKGIGNYSGTVTKNFMIKQAPLTIKAKDYEIEVGDSMPMYGFEYGSDSLMPGDTVITPPTYTCEVTDSKKDGTYKIAPSGAKVGRDGQEEDNYNIAYENGILTINKKPAVTHTVTFDMQGHGTAPDSADYTSIAAGSTIKKPANPTAEGYRFSGWYKEEACTNIWDFDKETVTGDLTLYAGWEEIISLADAEVSVVSDGVDGFTYNGKAQTPKVTVKLSDGTTLTEDEDYRLSYKNNKNAGIDATVTVTGIGTYSGMASTTFEIRPASLMIWAKDKTILINAPVPEENEYEYDMGDLMPGDRLLTEPTLSCGITSTAEEGEYEIEISGADAGSNYAISYKKGKLTVLDTSVSCTVTFDMRGHGTAPASIVTKAGGKISRPADPAAEGYFFSGWYKDEACTDIWDFDTDTVTEDLTLYAGWKEIISLADAEVSVVPDGVYGFIYNGEEQKPKVTVGLTDGTILTENVDYTLSYKNNRNAGTATVTVTGTGTYSGTASTTFEIRKIHLIIKPKDKTIRVGDPLPEETEYEYELAEGSGSLIGGDRLQYPTSSTCDVEDSGVTGEYPVVPSEDADAGDNYSISYRNGILKIVEEYVYFTVTFDVQGHGTAPAKLENVLEGSTITKPGEDPSEEGYRFGGWYKDAACTTAWSFAADKVQGDLTLYAKWEKESVSLLEGDVSLVETAFTYDGTEQKPEVVVSVSDSMLEEGTDYSLSYENNRNAGTATVTVTGTGSYSGTVSRTFVIRPAPLTIWAKDKTILINAPVPEEKEYEYGIGDLMPGDRLFTEPSFSCGITSTAEAGEYEIKISGADAGGNYVLTYLNGTLRVVSEYDLCTVTFDVQGHGTAPADYTDVKVGSTISRPADPEAAGYRFAGWYRDAAYTMAWDFDKDTVQTDLTLYAWWVKESIMIRDEDVSLEEGVFVYDGTMHRPKVTVTVSGVVLVAGQDYTLTYANNRDAGTATVHVLGINDYSGTAAGYFRIERRTLMILAKDKTILRGGPIPAGNAYEYEASGLAAGDALISEPSFSCAITSSDMAGQYDIVPYGADAGKNYTITYAAGKLTVADEYVSCTVTFDMMGHGGASISYVGIKVGDTIDRPSDPAEVGYRFAGWYKDRVCTKAWDFENDVVQADQVLYAKWLQLAVSGDEKGFAVQEVADLYYTGKQCKPVVSVYDGKMLLKAGKDYQIKYHNNINANKGGMKKTGNGAGAFFNPELPYVEIIGKGNYAKKAEVNFNILRRPVGDGGADPALGVKLKVNDQLVTAAGKSLKPFVSIKYGKTLRPDTDYTLKLTAVKAKDAAGGSITGEMNGAAVPAGYSGEFLLTIAGEGNYGGSICRTVYVADKAHLMKNTSVTLGKNQKNVTFAGKAVELNAAESDSADAFTVKYRGTVLRPGRDYTVGYRNHDRVGKAELILTGIGEYTGTKTAAFQIRGAKFSTNTVNVSGVADKVYTGKAWTQNDAVLTYSGGTGQTLAYGVDYTISYRNNINKGTATMTFKGREEAGYSGSFRKTFRITAVDISQAGQSESMKGLVFAYCKAGVKPVDEIILTNQNGSLLQNGRDYTLQYANNKAVADASDATPPVVIVKGRGNYTGELRVPFGIVKADLRGVTVKTSPVAYKDNQPPEYAYKTAVRLMDGGTTLREGRDYLIAYQNNTQADLKKYMKQANTGGGAPVAVITGSESSPYRLDGPIVIPLPVYQEKFRKTDMQVEFGNTLYTGSQVRPPVRVYYGGRLLVENADYTLLYGKNVKSGRNQGSVTVSGVAPKYGGSVTVKFDIVRKDITY